jgi:hypothetical protein
MPILSGPLQLAASDARETSATQEHELGVLATAADGSLYRYAQAGDTALDAGKLTVAATQIANHENIAVAAAAAVGATEVTVTLGATAATANYYADGYLVVNDADGEGVQYRISSHPAADASASLTVTLLDPVEVALTTSSEVTLLANPWKSVVISAADQADFATGWPEVAVTEGYFFWAKTRGVVAGLADEAVTAGLDLTIGSSTVGAVEAADAAGEQVIGTAIQALVDTEYRAFFAKID